MSDTQPRLATRLTALFQRLAEHQVDAYLVPSSDAHLNEYVPIYQRRRAAITGFTGSAGDALLCPEGSHLFVDSRYYLQADQEVDPAYFRIHKLGMEGAYTLTGWLTEMERQRGSLRVGFDPFSTSTEAYATYVKALKNVGSALVPITHNPVFEAYLVIEREHATCFTRVAPPAEVQQALAAQITFQDYGAYPEAVQRLGATPA